jgi:N-acetylated-alpha-linked acidic dipeptidase
MEKYGDPGFHRHVNIAKTLGLAGLRMADALVLPLNITRYAQELGIYLQKVEETAKIFDFTDINYDNMTAAISDLQKAAFLLDQEAANVTTSYAALGDIGCLRKRHHKARKLAKRIKNINARKMAFERGFIDAKGLPRRSWYKHLGVAPGELLGYGATTFPSSKCSGPFSGLSCSNTDPNN